jgi:4-hydroxy-4-methyl-2-oxoglutarate aldolase
VAQSTPDTRDIRAAFDFLSTSNVSDALDRLGLAGQTVGILPLWPGCPKIAGPAVTMQLRPDAPGSTAYGQLEAALACGPGDVLVVDNDNRADLNSFGGIVAFTSKRHGVQATVVDGGCRDLDEMQAIRYPIYGRGPVQTSVRGRTGFVGYNIPVRLAGVDVGPGDWLFGDVHGVCVVPGERVAEVLDLARRVYDYEEEIRRRIVAGEDPLEAHRRRSYDEQLKGDSPG